MRLSQLLPSCALLGLVSCDGEQSSSNRSAEPAPRKGGFAEVRAELVGGELTIADKEPQTFHIVVHVPAGHHAYLDKGDEGFLIPLSFSFPLLEAVGARVVTVSRPKGSRDDKVRATVVRDSGEFVFRLETAEARFSSGSETYVSLRYQICNDLTNICYPPREIQIPFRIAGS